jgi:maleamate amidohydrolase
MAGSEDLRLPDEIREGVYEHLKDLRRGFEKKMGSGGRVGFGERPALIVIDLAMGWTDPKYPNGTDLESVVEDTSKVLEVARQADIPIFFTTMAYGKDDPKSPSDLKRREGRIRDEYGSPPTLLDPRLGRQPTEKLIVKKYASCFKGTDLHEMLASLKVDTLIITGCSTSHCVYATCRDAASSFRVIVPEGAVGERCELFHLVNLLDIDLGLGDVVPLEEVVNYLKRIVTAQPVGTPP